MHFTASNAPAAQSALAEMTSAYGQVPLGKAEVVVALGGDGFMLSVLQGQRERAAAGETPLAVYGLNYGTLGFLMNRSTAFEPLPDLDVRVKAANPVTLTPLRVDAVLEDGSAWRRWAFNEVAVRRIGPQAASVRVAVDGTLRLERLAGDGVMVATPAGSAAYNYSAGGPILPLSASALALTAICPIAPRRWPGAVLPATAHVSIEVLEREKRPVGIVADTHEVDGVRSLTVAEDSSAGLVALFDDGHDLDARLLAVQFAS